LEIDSSLKEWEVYIQEYRKIKLNLSCLLELPKEEKEEENFKKLDLLQSYYNLWKNRKVIFYLKQWKKLIDHKKGKKKKNLIFSILLNFNF
jgi:hypothetical protein